MCKFNPGDLVTLRHDVRNKKHQVGIVQPYSKDPDIYIFGDERYYFVLHSDGSIVAYFESMLDNESIRDNEDALPYLPTIDSYYMEVVV